MEEQGFVVASGTHTLVAVSRKQVTQDQPCLFSFCGDFWHLVVFCSLYLHQITNLPDPFGDCEALKPQPITDCQLKCKTQWIVSKCSCHDYYMTAQTDGNGIAHKNHC